MDRWGYLGLLQATCSYQATAVNPGLSANEAAGVTGLLEGWG